MPATRKILIIDDDNNLRRMIAMFMESRGWEVSEAPNGKAGFERARTTLPDIVLCDFEMDQMNGYETLAAIRGDATTATIPFILMTGAPDQAGLRNTMERGADDYLPKPFGMEQLIHAVETRVDRIARARLEAEQKIGALRRQVTLALPHELKTPLHGILGLSELLAESYDSLSRSDVLSMVNDIHTCGERLQRLVTNYVGYLELLSLAANPDKAAAFARGSSPEAAAAIAGSARRVAQRNRRERDLDLDLQEGRPAIARENLDRLTEELVDNACKFSPHGSPIRVAAAPVGSRYEIRVRDSGRGLSPEQIRGIGAFVQFDRQRYEQQGVGLGLAISRLLVELHGGTLTIESAQTAGTTVTASLPVSA